MKPHVLAVRLDSEGDVLVTGPAIRAIAAGASRVTLLCGPRGRQAAELLPGVDEVIVHLAPWIDPEPDPVDREVTLALVDDLRSRQIDSAIIFTSFHQSALPAALLLRLAGVRMLAAISEDYPGSLLDVRHRVPDDIHEVERALSLAAAAGYSLPPRDDGDLRIRRDTAFAPPPPPYVILHPGASVPARAWLPERHAELAGRLATAGVRVVVTGTRSERTLTAFVAGSREGVTDLGARTSFAELAEIIAGAEAIVVGNTGPAHLAAAVGTPVVSLYAPTVPAVRWRPWRVDHVLLGDQEAACAGSRARVCPIAGHPCLASVTVEDVCAALGELAGIETREAVTA
jgi:ADP-heptose:LPS heptosyltransferase